MSGIKTTIKNKETHKTKLTSVHTDPFKKLFDLNVNFSDDVPCFHFSDQYCFNKMRGTEPFKRVLKIKVLDYTLFPTGQKYFDIDKRMFAGDNPDDKTVLLHNNFIIGYDFKRYRFKENLMWYLDRNGYYTNIHSKFIVFKNTWSLSHGDQEQRALMNAFLLGHILNRIVILPKFFCSWCGSENCTQIPDRRPQCSAYVHYSIRGLDNVFGRKYREHVFLKNPMVPDSIKRSVSPVIAFKFVPLNPKPDPNTYVDEKVLFNRNSSLPKCNRKNLPNCLVAAPFSSKSQPINIESLVSWLKPYSNYSVLRFQHLYGNLIDMNKYPDFKRKLADGVRFH